MRPDPERVALIGFGAIGQTLTRRFASSGDGISIGAVLHRSAPHLYDVSSAASFTSLEDLLEWRPSLVVEAAGHEAVRRLAVPILSAGVDLIIASVGALADDSVEAGIGAAAASGGRAILVSGSVGGLDALSAARCAGLDRVTYTGRKPPRAWAHPKAAATGAEGMDAPALLFEGTAREAARRFPKNANVTAAVALAGLGFDRTRVSLYADAGIERNVHEVEASGAFGRLRIRLENTALPANPASSLLAALSLEAAIRRYFASVVL